MDEENFDKLPIEERCVHKSWKARISGYSSAVARFEEITDEKSDEWNKYVPVIKTVLEDNNDPALEKGLEVVLNFTLKSSAAGKIVGEIISALVKRSVASPRARIRDLSTHICLAAVEIGKQKIVIEEISKGTESKNPKISAHCLNILTEIIKAFGTSVLPIDVVLQRLPVLLEDKDQNVRNAAKTLTVEVYQWLGEDLRFKLLKPDVLKPQKLAEIVSEIAKIETRSAVPSRFLRSQRNHRANTGLIEVREMAIHENDDVDRAEMERKDQYNDSEPVEILSRIPEEFFDQLKSLKWAERKSALESLEKLLIGADRIENGEYYDIIKQLIDVISKDVNVIVVCSAVKCVTYIAQKLRGNFSDYSTIVFKALLEKLKERKPSVVKTLREAMDAVSESSSLDQLVEDLLVALRNKNPSVKSEGALFLSRRFSRLSPTSLNRGSLKPLFPALVTCLSDQDPSVRDRSANALGVALSVLGGKALSPLFKDLEKTKLAKVKEYAESTSTESKTLNSKTAANDSAQKNYSTNQTQDSIRQSIKTPAAHDNKNAHDASKNKKNKKVIQKSIMPKEKIADLLPEGTMKALVDRDWSVRIQAISEVQKLVNSIPPDVSVDLGDLGPLLSSRILESNPKISTASINLVTSAAERSGPLSREQLRIFFPALFKVAGDVKGQVRDAALDCLNKYGENFGYNDIFKSEFLSDNLRSGSNLAKINLWRWIGGKLRDTTLMDVSKSDLESLLPSLFSSLEDKSADIRSEASRAVEGFLKSLNLETIVNCCDRFFSNPNNAVMKIIFDKHKSAFPEEACVASSKLPGPKKSKSAEKPSPIVSRKKVTFSESIEKLPLLDVNDLKNQRVIDEHKHKIAKWDFVTPRVEFVELLKGLMSAANFSQELLKLLFHSDFRCHIKAMDLLVEEIRRNSSAIICNLDLILRWLTLRFFDGNPTVLSKSLDFVITALGILKETNYCLLDSEALAFVPYLVLKLGDSKENVQYKVREILGELTSVYPASKLRKFVLEGAKSNIARQRANCLDVLASYINNYGESVYLKEFDSVSEVVGKLLKDRDAVVKKKALHMAGVLYDREGEKIMKIIEKHTGEDFRSIEDRIRKYSLSKPSAGQNQDNAADEVLSYHALQGDSLLENTSTSCPPENTELQPYSDPDHGIPNDSKLIKTGRFCWDEQLVQEVDDLANLTVQPAQLVDIDLGFLKDDRKTLGTFQRSQTSTLLHPSGLPPFFRYIEDVANDDLTTSKNSMDYIDMMINSGRGEAFLNFTDDLLRTVVTNLEKLGKRCVSNEVLENYGSAFTLLMTLCNERRFLERFSEERLCNVIEQLLVMLSDYKFSEIDHDVYKKTVNVLILRILDGATKTPLLCALLRLLGDTREKHVSGRLHELSMKCLWKFIRNQASYDDELEYRVVFSAIREFLKSFSRPWWKSAMDDSSLRTVKSLLREMVKLRGNRVFQDVETDDRELKEYFSRRMKSMSLKGPGEPQGDATQNLTPSQAKELSDIFSRIALDSPGGLRKFSKFKRQHPEVNVNGILSKKSPTLLKYIEAATGETEGMVSDSGGDEAPEADPMVEGSFSEEIGRIWNKLKSLQERIGTC